MRQLEFPTPLLRRPGKGSSLVAKQFRFNQRFGERRAIHCDKRFSRPRRSRMNFLRQQVLASTTLAQNQHRGISRRNAIRNLKRTPHLFRPANHRAELAFGSQLPAQRIVFLLQRSQLQKIGDPLPQFIQLKSFHKIVRRAQPQSVYRRFCRVQRGHHQHWHAASLLPL